MKIIFHYNNMMENNLTSENININLQIPKHLLEKAQKVTGFGYAETLLAGLESLTSNKIIKNPYQQLLAMEGSLKDTDCFSIPLDVLREDREF